MLSFITVLIEKLASVFHLILFLLAVSYSLRFYKKTKLSKFFFTLTFLVFLLTSTFYFPHYIAKRLESKFPVLSEPVIKKIHGKVYLHVLGSGYTANQDYPANAQMGLVALGRMSEAIRLYHLLDSAVIVTSGTTVSNGKTQAQVLKETLTAMGVENKSIETLDTPASTAEEAHDLEKKFGNNIKLIIVTDAIHMPRAVSLFRKNGFTDIIAAPANFKAMEGKAGHSYGLLPSLKHMVLTDQVLHEYLAEVKAFF